MEADPISNLIDNNTTKQCSSFSEAIKVLPPDTRPLYYINNVFHTIDHKICMLEMTLNSNSVVENVHYI